MCVQTNTKDNTLYDCSVNNSSKKNKKTEFDILIDEYTCNDKLKESIYEFIKMRKGIKKPTSAPVAVVEEVPLKTQMQIALEKAGIK